MSRHGFNHINLWILHSDCCLWLYAMYVYNVTIVLSDCVVVRPMRVVSCSHESVYANYKEEGGRRLLYCVLSVWWSDALCVGKIKGLRHNGGAVFVIIVLCAYEHKVLHAQYDYHLYIRNSSIVLIFCSTYAAKWSIDATARMKTLKSVYICETWHFVMKHYTRDDGSDVRCLWRIWMICSITSRLERWIVKVFDRRNINLAAFFLPLMWIQ